MATKTKRNIKPETIDMKPVVQPHGGAIYQVPKGGRAVGPGRPKGSPNKSSKLLKDAYLMAASALGHPVEKMVRVKKTQNEVIEYHTDEDGNEVPGKKVTIGYVHEARTEWAGRDSLLGYLTWLGKTHPQTFAQGLLKIMPLQVQSGEKGDEPGFYENKEEVLERLRAEGLPTNVVEAITAQVFDALDSKQRKPKAGT
jgi:hypothetical protein